MTHHLNLYCTRYFCHCSLTWCSGLESIHNLCYLFYCFTKKNKFLAGRKRVIFAANYFEEKQHFKNLPLDFNNGQSKHSLKIKITGFFGWDLWLFDVFLTNPGSKADAHD